MCFIFKNSHFAGFRLFLRYKSQIVTINDVISYVNKKFQIFDVF